MGANGGWLQIRVADRRRVMEALIEELAARGTRLVGRGYKATRTREVDCSFALDCGPSDWTTIVASHEALDFDLAVRLSERLEAIVFCSEAVDSSLYRAEGLLGRGAAKVAVQMDEDYRHWPDNVLGDRGYRNLTSRDEPAFEFLAFAGGLDRPAIDWGHVFGQSSGDRYCLTMSIEGVEAAYGGRVLSRSEVDALDVAAPEVVDALEARSAQGVPAQESTLRLRSQPSLYEVALEGCSYSRWVGSAGMCSLHYGVRSDDPAHWIYITEDASPELVFRVDAREGRPDTGWFRIQEQVIESLGLEPARSGKGCVTLERHGIAFFVEPDLIVDGAHEVLFVPAREVAKLRRADARRARAALLRAQVNFALNPAEPARMFGKQ